MIRGPRLEDTAGQRNPGDSERRARHGPRDAPTPLSPAVRTTILPTHTHAPSTSSSNGKRRETGCLATLTRKRDSRRKRNLPSSIRTGRSPSAGIQPEIQILGKLLPRSHLPTTAPSRIGHPCSLPPLHAVPTFTANGPYDVARTLVPTRMHPFLLTCN